MSQSSISHGGQHYTKYVTLELLLDAAFVADKLWGFMLEPAWPWRMAQGSPFSFRGSCLITNLPIGLRRLVNHLELACAVLSTI